MVVHDTTLNHKGYIKPNRAYATKLLFDVIQADKYVNFDLSENFLFPNIAAFKINDKTKQSIVNLISALTISWEYFPIEDEIKIYTDAIQKKYNSEIFDFWNLVLEQQRQTMKPRNKSHQSHYSIIVKNTSFIHLLYLTPIAIRYLFKNGPVALTRKVIARLRLSQSSEFS